MLWLENTGIFRVLYSSTPHDTTDPQPKYRAYFIQTVLQNVMKYIRTSCTKHVIEMFENDAMVCRLTLYKMFKSVLHQPCNLLVVERHEISLL